MYIQKNIFFVVIIILFSCGNPNNIKTTQFEVQEYQIYCDSTQLNNMFKHYKTNNYIPVVIQKNGVKRHGEMRIRGDSSREYDKKSLKIRITDSLSMDMKSVFNFNAEYADLSFLRSFFSSAIFKHLNYPCFSTRFSKIYINNQYHGLFLEVENMDKDFLKNNGLNPKGDLFKASKDGACLFEKQELETKWEKKTNTEDSWIGLERLIEDIHHLPNDKFYEYLVENFNYPMLIDYLAINAFIANGSTYYHNYYIYRDQDSDGKWILLPWDLDKTLSYYDWKPYKYNQTSSDWENDNPLIEKCFLNGVVFNDFKERVDYLGKIINKNFYHPIFNSAAQNLSNYIISDSTNQIKSKKDWKKTIEKDQKFLKNRSSNLIRSITNLPLSFRVQKLPSEVHIPFKFLWDKPEDSAGMHYELWISNNFLFPDSNTYKFQTSNNFYWMTNAIPLGSYYWKVIANKNNFTTEGFNSKNRFTLKKGTMLPKKINKNMVLKSINSPYIVGEDITIDAGVTMSIEPGVTILMEENTEIFCKGKLNAIGTKKNPVKIAPKSSGSYFESLYFLNNSAGYLKNVHITDGLINSKHSFLKLDSVIVSIKNRPMEIGEKRPSIIWGWYGEIELNNISLIGNNKGEGINISWAKNIKITNSEFYNTPDAIELINVKKGIISNNLVVDSPDDAIDLNSCSNIIIKKNTLLNNGDKGISIGVDWGNKFITSHGKSFNIQVNNNYVLGNNIGVAVKDSSEVYAQNNIISFNKEGLKLYKKHKKYQAGGSLYSTNDQIENNITNTYVDDISSLIITNKIDSIYINRSGASFLIPLLIKYEVQTNKIRLHNVGKITFRLDGWALLDQEKNNIYNFNKAHNIDPEKSMVISTGCPVKQENCFCASYLNYNGIDGLYLKNDDNKIIQLEKK